MEKIQRMYMHTKQLTLNSSIQIHVIDISTH